MIRETYWRAALIWRVIDGDTVRATVDLGHRVRSEQTFRLLRVNAPEMHAPDPAVRAAAQAAKDFVVQWLAIHETHNTTTLTWGGVEAAVWNIQSAKGDSFDRWLAEVECQQGHNLSDDLLAFGYAVPFKS